MGLTTMLSRHQSQTSQVRERKADRLHPVNELQRFRILVVCFFCSMCVSLTFAFELLSTQFRQQFQLSPGDMSTISTVGLALCYFSLPYSLIYENFGPTINFVICGVAGFIGAVGLGLTFQGKMGGNLASITVLYALMNVAAGLFDVSYISSLFELFPRNRGPVIGLSKVMTGLGTSIFSCLCNTIFNEDVASFVYFLAAFVVTVSLASVCLVRLPPYHMNYWRRRGKTTEELAELVATKPYYNEKFVPKARLLIGYGVVVAMIIFYAVEAPVIAYTPNVTRGGKIAVGVIAIVLVLCLFIPLLPIPALGGMYERAPAEYLEGLDSQSRTGGEEGATQEDGDESADKAASAKAPTKAAEARGAAASASASSDRTPVEPLEDAVEMSPISREGDAAALETKRRDGGSSDRSNADAAGDGEMDEIGSVDLEEAANSRQDPRYTAANWLGYMRQPEVWLLLGYLFLVQPMGIMVSFNSSTISIALTNVERSEGLSALYSAFLGVGNSLGRLLFGLFEGYVQHQDPANRKVLVTTSMFIVPVIGSIAGILLHVMPGNGILLPFILIFIQAGFTSALAALMFTSLFEKFHNALYCTGCFTFVADVVLFNRVLFGIWADKQHDDLNLDDSVECNEPVCVRMPLIVVTVMCAASSILALILHVRYTRFVRRVRAAAQAKRDAYLEAAEREVEEFEEVHRSGANSAVRRPKEVSNMADGESD